MDRFQCRMARAGALHSCCDFQTRGNSAARRLPPIAVARRFHNLTLHSDRAILASTLHSTAASEPYTNLTIRGENGSEVAHHPSNPEQNVIRHFVRQRCLFKIW